MKQLLHVAASGGLAGGLVDRAERGGGESGQVHVGAPQSFHAVRAERRHPLEGLVRHRLAEALGELAEPEPQAHVAAGRRQQRDGPVQRGTAGARQRLHEAREPLHAEIRIAAEQFVGAVAAQRHRHACAGGPAHQIGRQQRGIGQRLGQVGGDRVERRVQVGCGHIDDLVAHADMAGGLDRVRRFVEIAVAGAHGERGEARHRARGDGGQQAGIEAAGEEHAERNVGDRLPPHRLIQQRIQALQRAGGRGGRGPGQRRRPEALHAGATAIEGEQPGGGQLLDALPARQRARQVFELQQRIGRGRIGPGIAQRRVAPQRGDFRAEHQGAAGERVIERLLAEPVAREMQRAGGAAAPGEREHAVDAGQGFAHAVAAQQLEQHLGVGAVAQHHAGGAQLVGEGGETVDLAVEDQRVAAGRIDPGLGTAGEIYHGQAGMGQRDGGIGVAAGGVGTAMGECRQHRRERLGGRFARRREAGDAAHATSAANRRPAGRCRRGW